MAKADPVRKAAVALLRDLLPKTEFDPVRGQYQARGEPCWGNVNALLDALGMDIAPRGGLRRVRNT